MTGSAKRKAWGIAIGRAQLCLLAGVVLFLWLFFSFAHAQEGEERLLYAQDFEEGVRPPEWDLASGWEVVEYEGGYVLAGQGHEWALLNAGPWTDYRLRFRLKLEPGAELHANVRRSGMHRYFIGLTTQALYMAKQTGPQAFQHDLASAPPIGLEWVEVEIAAYGATITVFIDGRQVMSYTDPDPLAIGGVAFESLTAGRVLIDDVEVWGPEPAHPLTWVRTGGPLGGLGYDVRMDPRNPDVMYVTDAWAGVFKSTDGGKRWFPSNEGILTRAGTSGDAIPVFSLTIDPNNPDTLWAGTQNTRGIYKSTDGGATWVEMDEGVVEYDGITFRGFTVEPGNSDVVYAAAEIASWAWAGEERRGREFDLVKGVVYKTTDGGQHWKAIWRGDNLARYIWIDPRDPNVLYISTGIFDREAANSDPQRGLPGGEGVLKSTDGGQTWTHVNNGLGNLYVGSLFMHPENPDILLAGTGNNQYFDGAGVYLTTDGGATWRYVLKEEPIESVEFALANPNIAYAAGSEGFYRSEDGGHTWRRVSEQGWGAPGVRVGFPIDIQVDPRDPNRIFVNAYGGGNFLSTDGGRTWTDASKGYTGAQVRAIAVHPSQAATVYAAARSGIFVSHDGGQNWEGIAYPPMRVMEWNALAIDPGDPSHILASNNWEGAIISSKDGGRSWTVTKARLPKGVMSGWSALVFAPSDPQTAYAATAGFFSAGTFDPESRGAGIYRSQDGGETWHPVNTSLTEDANVRALAVDPKDAERVFAASTNKGVLRTLDGGETWEQAGNGTLPQQAFAIAMNPADSQELLAGFFFAGMYRSRDGGKTWQPVGGGIPPEAGVVDILFDPSNPQVVYAADAFSGVYRSEDGGETWVPINDGLHMRAVNALALSADGQHLYAATEGGGVYRLDLNGEPPTPAPPEEIPGAGTPSPKPTPLPTQPSFKQSPQPPTVPPSPTTAPLPEAHGGNRQTPCPGIVLPFTLIVLAQAYRRFHRRE